MTSPTPTRILVIGGGGREHALAWKLAGEPGVDLVAVAPGSAAIGLEPGVRTVPGVDALDPPAVVEAARAMAIELVVVGPEAPLAAGVADALIQAGVPVFGPTRAAARIETSKAFCHDVAECAGVRMARARAFGAGELDAALAFARVLDGPGLGLVVKADGLAAGKGVVVCDDLADAERQIETILAAGPVGGHPGPRSPMPLVVLEERLHGPEVSVIAVTDGREAIALPVARDHKRLGDGDAGPNTGGMGAYSPVPDLPDAEIAGILAAFHRPILAELARRGTPFRGFLYAGLILTADGPVLLECNARLGDPEAQVILPRLAGSLAPVLHAAAAGDLGPIVRALDADAGRGPGTLPGGTVALDAFPGAAVGIVLAARGYPGTPERGHPIAGLDAARALGALVFHAGTARRADGSFATNGGRVLVVVGRGADLADAHRRAEDAAAAIAWDGLQRRHDIAGVPTERGGPAVVAPGSVSGAAGAGR